VGGPGNIAALGPIVSWHSRIRSVHLTPLFFLVAIFLQGTFHNEVLCEILVVF